MDLNNIHKLTREVKENKFQFTYFSEKHKPVACIIETNKNFVEVVKNESIFQKMAIAKICQKRGWTRKDFDKYGYEKVKYKRMKE